MKETIDMISFIVIWALVSILYVVNIVQAFAGGFTTVHLTLKVIGILMPPVGAFMGIIDL